MAYIGVSPQNGVRKKHTYTSDANQTSFTGAGAEGITLSYKDSNFVDVYQNGVKLAEADYTSTSGTTIVLAQGAAANDIVEIIVYDVFSTSDMVSASDGGTFAGNVAMSGTLTLTGNGDFNGDLDVDGTLETDALTINGVTLAETISDTVGAMVSSNTETGITVTYQDGDNTLDFVVGTLNQDTTGTAANATLAATVTVTDSTANTNFPIVFHDESNALLDDTGALRYNPSTGELLVPKLTVAGTTTTVDTVTMNAANAVIFEGATADAHETTLTIVDPTADRTINLPNVSGTIPVLAAASNTAITSTPAELNILDGVTSTAAELNILDGATVVVGEINALDLGSTAVGTAIASKAVILDSNKDYTGIRNFTTTGVVTSNAGVVVDNITIDGTEIDLSSGDLTIDVAGDIILDADGGDIQFNDGGTHVATIKNTGSAIQLRSEVSDADLVFVGNDGGAATTLLTLDTSQAGYATFNSGVSLGGETKLGDNSKLILGAGDDLQIYHDGSNSHIDDTGTGSLILRGNSKVELQKYTGEVMVSANADGSVDLYHNDSKKFETTAGGITIFDQELKVTDATGDNADKTGAFTTGHYDTDEENVAGIIVNSANGDNIVNIGGAFNAYNAATKVRFFTAANATTVSGTERMRIVNDRVLIGRTTGNSLTNYPFDIFSSSPVNMCTETNTTNAFRHHDFHNPNGLVGNIQTSGSGTSFVTSSDYRLKENLEYSFDATTRLKQLKPCRFNFKTDADTTVDGFIAHEVSSIVPEAISGTKDAMTEEVLYVDGDEIPDGKKVGDVKEAAQIDPQGIDQSKLVPLLVKTIQELEARITALESA